MALAFVCFSFVYQFRSFKLITVTLSFSVHLKLFYRILSGDAKMI